MHLIFGQFSHMRRDGKLMIDGVHHYDENGLTDHSKEPSRIRDVHEFEISFITEWIAQFKEAKKQK